MSATGAQRTADSVPAGEALQLAARLVRCPSVGPGPALEEAFAVLATYLRDRAISCSIARPDPEHPVLLAWVESGQPGTRLLFQGHLDVVPAGEAWTADPFSARIGDGRLHGRGACDMKAGVAAAATALARLRAAGEPQSGAIGLLVVPDEERGSDNGLLPFLASERLAADWAICAEPTAMNPLLGNRGLLWARIVVDGQAGHAGMPERAANPVPVAAELVGELGSLSLPVAGEPGLPAASLTVTGLHAGEAVNVIPGRAELSVDRRLDPTEDPQESVGAIAEAVDRVAARHPRCRLDLQVQKIWPPCRLDANSALAQVALDCARELRPNAHLGFDEAANDSSFLAAAGIPTVLWGPGEPEMAHRDQESIPTSEIEVAVAAFQAAALRLTGEARP